MIKNQAKTASISLITLVITAILIWRGLTPVLNNLSESQVLEPTPAPVADQVLGKSEVATPQATLKKGEAIVTKVVDGDTIEVNIAGVLKKVRYIGVNTPETVDPRRGVECFGREASNENKRLVLGKQVHLEKDISETDKFGRLLRFIHLPLDDGTTLFVNDYLVREGFAYASTYPPDVKFAEKFKEAEVKARENKKGLWNSCN